MDELLNSIFGKYGLNGLILALVALSCFWMMRKCWGLLEKQASIFMAAIEKRDNVMLSHSDRVLNVLTGNAAASEKLASSNEDVASSIERLLAQNRDEHGQILEYVRRAK